MLELLEKGEVPKILKALPPNIQRQEINRAISQLKQQQTLLSKVSLAAACAAGRKEIKENAILRQRLGLITSPGTPTFSRVP